MTFQEFQKKLKKEIAEERGKVFTTEEQALLLKAGLAGVRMTALAPKPPKKVTLAREDGTTTCCNAYTTYSMDDEQEYCRACYRTVEGRF